MKLIIDDAYKVARLLNASSNYSIRMMREGDFYQLLATDANLESIYFEHLWAVLWLLRYFKEQRNLYTL